MHGNQTPCDKSLQKGRAARHNHLCQFFWLLVKGFGRGGGGVNFLDSLLTYVVTLSTGQPGNQVSTSFGNNGLCWIVFAQNRDTAMPAEGNGDLQTLICVLVARPRRCLTLSNPVPGQNWMAAYLGYTLRMKMLFRCWPVMAHWTHTIRRPFQHTSVRISD